MRCDVYSHEKKNSKTQKKKKKTSRASKAIECFHLFRSFVRCVHIVHTHIEWNASLLRVAEYSIRKEIDRFSQVYDSIFRAIDTAHNSHRRSKTLCNLLSIEWNKRKSTKFVTEKSEQTKWKRELQQKKLFLDLQSVSWPRKTCQGNWLQCKWYHCSCVHTNWPVFDFQLNEEEEVCTRTCAPAAIRRIATNETN